MRRFYWAMATAGAFALLLSGRSGASTIPSGASIAVGSSYYSDNQLYRLVMQGDGNLVLYRANGSARWNSQTSFAPGASAYVQGDGNVVIYSAASQAIWYTGTGGNPGAYLSIQDDGNLVVRRGYDNAPLWDIGADPNGPQFPTRAVNLASFMTSAPPSTMCQADGLLCMTSRWNGYGEFEILYSNGIVDYIARSTATGTTPAQPVGVVRNVAGDVGGSLRCFASAGQVCSGPPTSDNFPEAVPASATLNVVPWTTARQAENQGSSVPGAAGAGTPRTTIQGAIQLTGWRTFQEQFMNSSCQQTPGAALQNQVSIVYVTDVDFGGDLGVNDALVIDEQERAAGATTPHHIERYFYVAGWGRVREASAHYNSNTGVYDLHETGISTRNTYASRFATPAAIPNPTNLCPQGSAAWN